MTDREKLIQIMMDFSQCFLCPKDIPCKKCEVYDEIERKADFLIANNVVVKRDTKNKSIL